MHLFYTIISNYGVTVEIYAFLILVRNSIFGVIFERESNVLRVFIYCFRGCSAHPLPLLAIQISVLEMRFGCVSLVTWRFLETFRRGPKSVSAKCLRDKLSFIWSDHVLLFTHSSSASYDYD